MLIFRLPRRISAALLLSFGFAGLGAAQGPLVCMTNAPMPMQARADGLAEFMGDFVVNCTGGTPTPVGAPVPLTDIQLFMDTEVTSRIIANGWSEALLMIDDPPPTIQRLCGTAGDKQTQPGVCAITGNGTGIGTYDGSAGRPNVFQGQQSGTNSILWAGVPLDPPGGFPSSRVLRITNIRANASHFRGSASSSGADPMFATITSSGQGAFLISNPQQIVAFVFSDVSSTVTTPLQCLGTVGGYKAASTTVQFTEGFSSVFRVRTLAGSASPPADQNVPGISYPASETDFFNSAFPAFTGRGNLAQAGLADEGTRIIVRFSNVPPGIMLFSPADIHGGSAFPLLEARRVSTGPYGGGPYSPTPAGSTGFAVFANVSGTAVAVYEILGQDPFNVEQLNIPVFVLDVGHVGLNSLVNSSVTVGLAPLSNVVDASVTAPVPRFAAPTAAPVLVPTPNCP
jgi:hypothetical protein